MFESEFMRLALGAGAIVGVLAPAVGFFLVQRRQSLMGDGIGHVAFAGVAAGILLDVSPVLTALVAAVLGGIAIELLRSRGRTAGDQALAIVFYTGIALGVVLVAQAGALNVDLFQYLFGSILTVTRSDLVGHRTARRGRARDRCDALSRVRRDRHRRGGRTRLRRSDRNAQHRARHPDGRHRRALDACRRDPPRRGADGAPGERCGTDRVEHALDPRPGDGDRSRSGHRRPHHLVLRRSATRRDDRARGGRLHISSLLRRALPAAGREAREARPYAATSAAPTPASWQSRHRASYCSAAPTTTVSPEYGAGSPSTRR